MLTSVIPYNLTLELEQDHVAMVTHYLTNILDTSHVSHNM